jgi:hypothetical protein
MTISSKHIELINLFVNSLLIEYKISTTYLSLEMAFRKILENFELQKKYKR